MVALGEANVPVWPRFGQGAVNWTNRIYAAAMEREEIEGIVTAAARMAFEGIVQTSYTPAERERLDHAARTGEWRPMPPLGM